MIHIWLAVGTVMGTCTSALHKAIEFLCRAMFCNQTRFSSSSGTRLKGLEFKEDGWVKLRDQVCDRFLAVLYWSPVEAFVSSEYPGTFATNNYGTVMLFFRPDYGSLSSDQENWKLEFFHLRNAPKHRKPKNNTNLQPHINRTPSHMGLIWRRHLLT